MLFNSLQFLGFFVVVWPLYWLLPHGRGRTFFLVAVSLYFYANWNGFFAVVLAVSTVIDFFIARLLQATEEERRRRSLLVISLVMNLALLVIFKYLNFIGQSLNALASQPWIPDLTMPSPVGISFYTFEAISYTTDVYRRKVRAESRLEHLLFFITFFPHVVAGPIVRARSFLPQIPRPKSWSWTRIQLGLSYFAMGLFKKAALADRLALIVDPIFLSPYNYSSAAVAAAVLAYSIQIYCDFSGYTDMAIGLAHLFGFRLAPNFNMPYSSESISEFWRRWHISLSSWLRDYLYIPLGGNQSAGWRVYRNLMITMLLGGLWHGASWNFVLWGGLHGVFLCLHRAYRGLFSWRLPRALNILLCFGCVTLAWVPFRASDPAVTLEIYRHLLVPTGGNQLPVAWSAFWAPVLWVAVATWMGRLRFHRQLWQFPGWLLGAGVALLALLGLVFQPQQSEPFIYFQF